MQNDDLQALLNQLRESQDKIESSTAGNSTSASHPPQTTTLTTNTNAGSNSNVPSQAQLDSLLQSMKQHHRSDQRTVTQRTRDLTQLSYAEAVPIVQSLCMDDSLVENVRRMVKSQHELEQTLADERTALKKELVTKGTSAPGINSKLRLWDKSALSKWQKRYSEQQAALQQLGVPTFHRTKDPVILRKQARVLNVLLGFIERDDEDE
ncbi:hypothetical protein OIV83_005948 [Microbotryomycetes sp. JL201]|nr:hypothetical protein OIV83_005948 [Microbotryomycetes sp. JL201]